VAEAALANPKQDQESADYWIARVIEASKAETVSAADLGVASTMRWTGRWPRRHARQNWLLTSPCTRMGRGDRIRNYGSRNRAGQRGGRLCGPGRRACSNTEGGNRDPGLQDAEDGGRKAVTPYDGQGMQLAAYAAAHYGAGALPRVLAANVFISTTEPGRMVVC